MLPTILAPVRRLVRRIRRRRWPAHPIDRLYGIETSSFVDPALLASGDAMLDGRNIGYVGSQPSIVRRALGSIEGIEAATFVDLGCGKGRALAVASEFPFRRILGIEVSVELCRQAEANAAAMVRAHPGRTPIEVVQGDASAPPLAGLGLAVLYLYNSFDGEILARLVRTIEASLAADPDLRLFLIYYNPVAFAAFDASPALIRHAAERVEVADEERASSPFGNAFDSVVVYQSRHPRMQPPRPGAGRAVRITVPRYGAEVDA
jgi:SAM-dependent methyltransferase